MSREKRDAQVASGLLGELSMQDFEPDPQLITRATGVNELIEQFLPQGESSVHGRPVQQQPVKSGFDTTPISPGQPPGGPWRQS